MADLYSMHSQFHLGARDKYDIIVVFGEVRFECATSFHVAVCTVFFVMFHAAPTSGHARLQGDSSRHLYLVKVKVPD